MPDHMLTPQEAVRTSRRMFWATMANIVFTVTAMSIFVWQVGKHAEGARAENCELISQALDAYTLGLIAATDQGDRTPEMQKSLEESVKILHATYDPILQECG